MLQAVAVIVRVAVTAAARLRSTELPAVSRAHAIIRLVAEPRTDHQILILRDLPLQTGVEAVVVTPRIGVAARHQRVERHRRLVPLVDRREVPRVGIVEEVAALDRHLVAFAPRVGVVHAEGVDRGHAALRTHHVLAHAAAATASAARDAQNILEREVLLVDVVEQADQRDAGVAREDVGVTAGQVLEPILGGRLGVVAESGIELSELPLPHAGFRDDVERLVSLAVVHAREFGRIGELVIDLHPVDGLGRQRLDRRGDILAEELLAVDEDLLDLLALRLDHAVRHGDAGHLFQQSLHVGVVRHLERPGVVAHRIALLRRPHGLHLLDHRLDLHARFEAQRAEIQTRGRQPERRVEVIVPDERYRQGIFPVGERGDRRGTLVPRRKALFLVRRLRRSNRQHGADDAVPGFRIDDRRCHAALLGEGCGREERQQGCQ